MLNKYFIFLIINISFSQNFIYDSDDWYIIKNPGSIHSITEGPFNVYFGCENGIFTYNKFDENIEYDYQLNRGLESESPIHYIHYDHYSDQIWIVNNRGIYFKNPIFNEYQRANFNLNPYSISAFGSIDQYIILEYLSEYIIIDSFSGSTVHDYSSIDFNQISWSSSYSNYDNNIDLSTYYSDDWLIGFKNITDKYGNEETAIVFFEDNDFNLWYGTNKGKLIRGYKYSNKVDILNIGPYWNTITSMTRNQEGDWYLSSGRFRRYGYKNEQNYYKGSNPFISTWNEYDNSWGHFNESNFSNISNPDINCHLNINEDFLVLGTMEGIIVISIHDPNNFRVISKKDGLNDRAVFDLKEYNDQLFIMTPEGISVYSMKYNIVTNENILDSFNLVDPEILDIIVLNDDLFFSTRAGLFKYSILDEEIEKISNQTFRQIDFYNGQIIGLNESLWLVDYIYNNEKIIYFETSRNFKIIDDYIWLNLIDKIKLINLDSMEEWVYNHNDGFINIEFFDIKDDEDWVYFLTNQGVIFYNWSNYHF